MSRAISSAGFAASLYPHAPRIRTCIGDEKLDNNPSLLPGMCGMCYEEEPYIVNESEPLSDPWQM